MYFNYLLTQFPNNSFIIRTLLVVVFISASLKSQWTIQNSYTIDQLRSIFFLNPDTGFVVGSYGTILKTTNSGNNWIIKQSSTTSTLSSVYFINNNTGLAVGSDGTLLKTTNCGESWTKYLLSSYSLHEIKFSSENDGWIVGYENTILKTSDGGSSWQTVNFNFYTDIYAISNTGTEFVCVGGDYWGQGSTIGRTTNGGLSWDVRVYQIAWPLAIYFTDKDNGVLVGGSGLILKTINGGLSWFYPTYSTSQHLEDVCLVNSNFGWAVGNNGTVLKTADGGFNWTLQITPTSKWLNCVYFINDSLGWAAGNDGMILRYKKTTVDIENPHLEVPTDFELMQNFPNPFNPVTTIKYCLKEDDNAHLIVLNSLGEEVQTLVNEKQRAGYHSINFNGDNLPSGIYLYRIQVGNYVETKKMILLK